MFSVIFEVNRKPDHLDVYMEKAGLLKPILREIHGFIDNERFESQIKQGWLLSHSTWRDEKSVLRWRTEAKHHQVQKVGRFEIFQDYHLRVGEIVSDTSPPPGIPLKEDRFDATEAGSGKFASFTEFHLDDGAKFADHAEEIAAHFGVDLNSDGLLNYEIYKGASAIYPDNREYVPGKWCLLLGWTTEAAAKSWTPKPFDGARDLRHRVVRVIRDYGMFDRREAPQYYPEVESAGA